MWNSERPSKPCTAAKNTRIWGNSNHQKWQKISNEPRYLELISEFIIGYKKNLTKKKIGFTRGFKILYFFSNIKDIRLKKKSM